MRTTLFTSMLISQLLGFIPQIALFYTDELCVQKVSFSIILGTLHKTNNTLSNYKIEKIEQNQAPENVLMLNDVVV